MSNRAQLFFEKNIEAVFSFWLNIRILSAVYFFKNDPYPNKNLWRKEDKNRLLLWKLAM